MPSPMPITPPALEFALDSLETEITNSLLQPRNEEELIARIETFVGQAMTVHPNRVYVPDAEAPVTPDTKDAHISGPLALVTPQTRILSARALTVITRLLALVSETNAIVAGLDASIAAASADLVAAKALIGSTSLQWMRFSDTFLDLSHVDPSLSSAVVVETTTGNGVSIAPSGEQDLTPTISKISLIESRSGHGLPGDNLELSALQGVPGTGSPAAGSATSLATARQNAGASGGSGQEPTVSFAGVPDLHANLGAVTSDQPETWFEWETVYVPPVQKCVVHGTAYVADPAGSFLDVMDITHNYGWSATVQNSDGTTRTAKLAVFAARPPIVGRDGPLSNLQLSLEIDMGEPVPVNQMGITVRQTGGLWPTIRGVEVSLNHNNWLPMRCQGNALTWQGAASASSASAAQIASGGGITASGDGVLGGSLWQIPSYASVDPNVGVPQFRYLSMTFVQPDAYACPKGIGHPYYTKVTKTTSDSKAVFGLIHHHSENTQTERLPTPDQLVGVTTGVVSKDTKSPGQSIGNILGLAATAALGVSFGGPLASSVGGIGNLVSGVVTGLIGSSSKTTDILQEGEYADVFQAFRQCISVVRIRPLSRTYSTSVPGQLVSPSISFGHPFTAVRMIVDQRQGSGTTIDYSISVDDGGTWLPITPMDIGQPPAPYLGVSPLFTVDLGGTYNTLRYRATLSTSQAHATPSLLGVLLEVLPA